MNSLPAPRVFVSHSARDRELADAFVELLCSCLDVRDEDIRCTSAAGHGMRLGARPSEALRLDLQGASYVVGLLTKGSVASPWVLFELGAAWALDKHPAPLLSADMSFDDLPSPLRDANSAHLNDATALGQVIEELSRHADLKLRGIDKITKAIRKFVQFASAQPSEIGGLPVRESSQPGEFSLAVEGALADFDSNQEFAKIGFSVRIRNAGAWLQDLRVSAILPQLGAAPFVPRPGLNLVEFYPVPGLGAAWANFRTASAASLAPFDDVAFVLDNPARLPRFRSETVLRGVIVVSAAHTATQIHQLQLTFDDSNHPWAQPVPLVTKLPADARGVVAVQHRFNAAWLLSPPPSSRVNPSTSA